ncbi:rRNA processing/ribosome biogenesis-domain-containing protein [Pholiota molesta]|nr:rRNA processing/ribosome biogenesis-domain-containing protein [Pholiota molesta]
MFVHAIIGRLCLQIFERQDLNSKKVKQALDSAKRSGNAIAFSNMDSSTHLKQLLQTSAICLSTLTKEHLQPSSHLTKWTTRIHSLLHSKEPGGRWAGLCLAYKSSLLSQSLMIDSAQSWVGVVLPLLSRNEPLPTIKAAIRLLRVIFSTAIDIPEFHRQVSLPHVVKFTSALMPLADSHLDVELKVLCMETLTRLIPLYPTTHRASSGALSAFTLRYLNGSPTGFTNEFILHSASQLYATIPLTGGKVGAVNLWRKSLEETLAFGWEAFYALRTTSLIEGQNIARPVPSDEPQFAIPINQDRLLCSIVILCDLLRAIIERPVQVPIGNLIKFVTALLASSADQEIDGFVDSSIRAMELAVVPDLWNAGCDLLICLALRFPHRLDAHAGRLLSILAHRLEQKHNTDNRLHFVKAIDALLKNCYPLHSSILPARLAKSVLPSISKILTTSSGTPTDNEPSSSKSKSGKKRARNYEGDEVFKTRYQTACPTAKEEQILLTSIDVIQSLFNNPNLSPSLQSIIARIVTSILISVPRMSPSSLSSDPSFIHIVNTKIQKFSVVIGSGTTSVMSKTLPFVIESALGGDIPDIQRDIGLLLHPRVPPLVRSMPHVEALSLFKAEESQEEAEALAALEAKPMDSQPIEKAQEDIMMRDPISVPATIPAAKAPPSMTPSNEMAPVKEISNIPLPSQPISINEPSTKKDGDITPAMESTPLPSSRIGPMTQIAPKVSPSRPLVPIHQAEDEDEDEEMPAINMDSDSEDESS